MTVTQVLDGGWWEGTLNGKTGWFPSNYVKEVKAGECKVSVLKKIFWFKNTIPACQRKVRNGIRKERKKRGKVLFISDSNLNIYLMKVEFGGFVGCLVICF